MAGAATLAVSDFKIPDLAPRRCQMQPSAEPSHELTPAASEVRALGEPASWLQRHHTSFGTALPSALRPFKSPRHKRLQPRTA